MPAIIIEDLTEQQKEEMDVIKARGRYSSWKEMIVEELGISERIDAEDENI